MEHFQIQFPFVKLLLYLCMVYENTFDKKAVN
jgi:hypothetical protein